MLAAAAEVTVDQEVPKRAKARFFERVQAGDLADAIARRGQPVDVRPGQHRLKVPCDSIKRGSFADITVTIDDDSDTRLRLQDCGLQVDSRSNPGSGHIYWQLPGIIGGDPADVGPCLVP